MAAWRFTVWVGVNSVLSLGRVHRLAAVLLMGFASGLPLALTGQALQAWLTIDGVNIATIGFFGLVGIPYTFKFLWAPLMDRFEPPWLGRRRGWLVLSQLSLAATLCFMSTLSPSAQPVLFGQWAVLLAFPFRLAGRRGRCLSG
jgi:PAT family beta-lactamase induction signal transducer AmpG